MQNSQHFSQYVMGRDTAVTLASITSSPSASPLMNSGTSSESPGSHHFQGGTLVGLSQSSPVLNSLISGQAQSMFSGIYTSPTSFSNSTAFPSFNGFIEPTVWFSDTSTQVPVPSPNSTSLVENGRVSHNQCSDKKMSFCSSRLGILEGISMCSPLPTEMYKTSSKDYSSFQSKASNLVDSQNWLCTPGIGYGNQQNQHCIQQTSLKCNDQFSSCSISQANVLPDHELKHLTNTNYEDFCCVVSSNNRRSPDKQTMHCSNVQIKSGFAEKEHQTKYPCSFTKDRDDDQTVNHSCAQSKQMTDQDNFESMTSTYTSNTSLHEHSVFSQIPSINNETVQPSRKQPSHTTLDGQMPILQQHFHDPGMSCDIMDSCLQVNRNRNSKNFSERSSCCNIGANDDLSSVASHSFTLRQPLHCFSDCLNLPNMIHYPNNIPQFDCSEQEGKDQLCSSGINAAGRLKLDCDIENVKDNSIECSSMAGESDIIVEESEDESDSEISIEEVNKASSERCWVCHAVATSHAPNYKLIQVNQTKPVTSSSQVPVLNKLAQVFLDDKSLLLNTNELLCKICLNLLETFDHLETKLDLVKNDLFHRYSRKEKVFEMYRDSGLKEDVSGFAEKKTMDLDKLPVSGMQVDFSEPDAPPQINEIVCPVMLGVPVVESESDKIATPPVLLAVEKEITNRPKYECTVCKKYFASKDYLRKHQQQHTKKFSYYCDRCGRGFMIRRCLENHLRMHSGEFQYQCEVCGKRFIQRYNLDNHLRKHNKQYRVKCAQCGRGFMNANALGVHLRTHTDERPFVCQKCEKCFKNNSNLVAHRKLCLGELDFHCEKCDKSFSSKAQIRNHELSQHGGTFAHSCNICHRGFIKASDCRAHMVSHTGEKAHVCGVCGKSYTSLGNLNQHAAQHKDDRPYKCTVCEKSFTRRGGLVEHMNHHSGLRSFACEQCDKTFVTRRNLQAHQKWHAGTLKLYTCNICGKTVKHGLQIHMRSHSGHKPYKCSKCDMAFTVKSTLNKHFKMKHFEEGSS